MNWRRTAVALAMAAGTLWGCATQEKYEEIMRTWIGARESALVASWGTPDGFYEADGTRYLTYRRTSRLHIPGTPPTYYTNTIAGHTTVTAVGGSAPYTRYSSCESTFLVRNGAIRSYTIRGDDCVSQ